MNRIKKDWRPVLKGYVFNGQIYIWCPYCVKYHHHSWLDDSYSGHRTAHCATTPRGNENSPFINGGYYVVPFSKTELKRMVKGG